MFVYKAHVNVSLLTAVIIEIFTPVLHVLKDIVDERKLFTDRGSS
jgi:hypothetical protein